ncbi:MULTISPECIES: ABC transporter ATP-binding protein [Paenibacillus]|uniref:ABC transporter ATP-binding protein n=1 Tax=Paenibacillus TaxID=44249 RepID=UPI0003E1E611|nr:MULTISPECIES: ATP-binding cassette domain-containing protein [Paenibacillus]ETT45360.1 ABC transporter [Paenibacillus sp. FSL H8-237]
MDIITVKNLTKQYETYHRGQDAKSVFKSLFHREKSIINSVEDLSFSVGKGEMIGILGPNGAGKSTTIKMLTGVLYPTSGEINVLGYNPHKQKNQYVKQIGVLFGQKSQLIWDIPPLDSFYMNKEIYDIPTNDFRTRLDRFVNMFEIGDIITKPTRTLSLGERMKCEFIMAMLHSPPVVFLDEPTIGLDVIAKQRIREFIKQMNQEGTTFILTTHDLEDVERLVQRVLIIHQGKKVYDDKFSELRLHLGAQKVVRLSAATTIGNIDLPGTQISERISDYEVELLIDTEQCKMGEFLHILSEKVEILDISIKEIPIEKIISSIYEMDMGEHIQA